MVAKQHGVEVVIASAWPVRALRQKQAKERDKALIHALETKLQMLQQEVREWRQWWTRYVQWGPAEEEEWSVDVMLSALGRRDEGQISVRCQLQQQQQQQQGNPVSVIDYSKWDHFGEEASEIEDDYDGGSYWGASSYEDEIEAEGEEEGGEEDDCDDAEREAEEESEDGQEKGDYPDGGSGDLTQDQSLGYAEGNFGFKVFDPSGCEEEKKAMENAAEIDNALGSNFASNKAIILMRMEDAKRTIETHAARNGSNDMTQQHQQQIESYLPMATQLEVHQYNEEGTKALVSIIKKWQTEAMQHLHAGIEDVEKGWRLRNITTIRLTNSFNPAHCINRRKARRSRPKCVAIAVCCSIIEEKKSKSAAVALTTGYEQESALMSMEN